ncbi:Nucleotidyl transferase AbiEii toxin, Type IV TA system [Sphingomonas sp. NFR15]|nr:Nucleotidyl transferase AbiEii toxin, Type IV TA system [Sphingomonas sp. NFR15]
MMNPAYDRILAADDETRAGLFTTTAQRLGTTPQNAEKDFWVCWVLDALFNGRVDGPRLLFKGGTSLSKGFGLISRFSEDIDVTVFRDDLGQAYSVDELAKLSGKKREAALDAIKTACAAYITGPLLAELSDIAARASDRNGLPAGALKILPHPKDDQTLLVHYPTATPSDGYVDQQVKIESGAKSALAPHSTRIVRPYVEADAPGLDLAVANVTVVDAERTFWDKVVILHGQSQWFINRGDLQGGGNRVSRHYYDVHTLMTSEEGKRAMADPALGADCVAHARMFFDRKPYNLAIAQPPTFTLVPEGDMYDVLRRDYVAMSAMIFGPPPRFDAVIESVTALEAIVNRV